MQSHSIALRALLASAGIGVLSACSSGAQPTIANEDPIVQARQALLVCVDAPTNVPAGVWQCGESRTIECASPSGTLAPSLYVAPRQPSLAPATPLTCDDVMLAVDSDGTANAYAVGRHELIISQMVLGEAPLEVCRATLTVADTKPPVVTTHDQSLWPPNHEMHRIAIADCADAVDTCDPHVRVFFTKATSDEPVDAKGDGHAAPDIAASCTSIDLRSERQGGSDGRVYRLFWRAIDRSGNAVDGSCRVAVAHDQSGRDATEGAAVYAVDVGAALSGCP